MPIYLPPSLPTSLLVGASKSNCKPKGNSRGNQFQFQCQCQFQFQLHNTCHTRTDIECEGHCAPNFWVNFMKNEKLIEK